MASSGQSHIQRGLLLGVVLAIVGVALALAGANALVSDDARRLAGVLTLAAALAFFGVSLSTEEVLSRHGRLAQTLHWLAMSVLVLVATIGLGYLAVSWTQHSSVSLRLLADLIVAVLAGAAATALVVVIGIAVMLLLKLASWLGIHLPPTATPGRNVSKLQAEHARWRRPWARLPQRLARTIALSVGGVSLSILAETIAHELDLSPSARKLLAPGVAWFVGSALGWILVTRWLRFPSTHTRNRHTIHALGFAAVILAVATTGFAETAAHTAKGRLWKTEPNLVYGASDASVTVPAKLSRAKLDQLLADAFAPDLRFTDGERWHPTSVDWFQQTARTIAPFKAPDGKPRCPNSCLALECDDLAGDCTSSAAQQPTIYVLVKHGDVGSKIPRGYEDVSTVLEYWLFYNYDAFDRWPISQWHQADWEQVTVGLAGTRPRFVAYSEHCFGTWLPWTRVVVESADSTHPLVYVGEGTHANYPRAFSFPLRGASCARPAQPLYYGLVALAFALAEPGGRLEVPADYALGETDRTGHETIPNLDVRVVDPADPKLTAFPGTWGLDNRLAFGRSKTGNYAGGAPNSPANHGEWRDPTANILCNPTWFTPKRPRCHPTNT